MGPISWGPPGSRARSLYLQEEDEQQRFNKGKDQKKADAEEAAKAPAACASAPEEPAAPLSNEEVGAPAPGPGAHAGEQRSFRPGGPRGCAHSTPQDGLHVPAFQATVGGAPGAAWWLLSPPPNELGVPFPVVPELRQ